MYNNYSYLYESCLPSFGGYYGYGADPGALCLNVYTSVAFSYAVLGGRLMFL